MPTDFIILLVVFVPVEISGDFYCYRKNLQSFIEVNIVPFQLLQMFLLGMNNQLKVGNEQVLIFNKYIRIVDIISRIYVL